MTSTQARPALDKALIDALAISHIERLELPGLALGVIPREGAPLICNYGYADIASERQITEDTVFRVGSISKTFTGLAVMSLVERGLIGLDDPANDHVRACRIEPPQPGDPAVTVRHLLTHTGGLGEIPRARDLLHPLRAFGAAPRGSPLPSLVEVLGPRLPAEVAAGTKWAYSNLGFVFLGLLVEEVSGMPFAQYVKARVLDPSGMSNTLVTRTDLIADRQDGDANLRLATGYKIRRGDPSVVREYEICLGPAGGYFSTATDLCHYARMLLNGGAAGHGGTRVVDTETLDAMFEPKVAVDTRLPATGLAFSVRDVDNEEFGGGLRTAGHGGTVPGFTSGVVVAPEAGIAVIALANRTVMPSATFGASGIAALVLAELLGQSSFTAAEFDGGLAHATDDVCGTYRPEPGFWTNARIHQFCGGEIHIACRGAELVARAPLGPLRGGLALTPFGDGDPLAFAADVRGYRMPFIFVRDDTGDVATLHTGFAPVPFTLHAGSRWRSPHLWVEAAAAGAATAAGAGIAHVVQRRLGR